MGYNQETYDAECAALARALEMVTQRRSLPERVTVFIDAQSTIRCMASDEPSPGQVYARPDDISQRLGRPARSSPLRCGGAPLTRDSGEEKADEWASSQRRSRTPGEWSGYDTRAGMEGAHASPQISRPP
jgi:hypothetical protein